ncbi:MAG: methyltransferase domain-containing protein [Oscillospiraceae bacterium]|nr:methyltransferase domain-containing protein [Oscillospiraceae bacterium]
MSLEKMDDYFNSRVEIYENDMIGNRLDELYERIANLVDIDSTSPKLLDLGCGTGLELERLFTKYPDMNVTGIDLSSEMLNKLKNKYKDKNINLICGSYFDINFGSDYDVVLSTYSLHHFNETEKLLIYKKVYDSMKSGRLYIEGDKNAKTEELQQFHLSELERLKKEQNVSDGSFYHYDTPLTVENQIKLLKLAGFTNIKIMRHVENETIGESIIIARKPNYSYLVDFDNMDWSEPATGLKFKAFANGSQQIRLVEFSEGFVESDWCKKGHAGYVLDGEFANDYNGVLERYKKGDVIFIPKGEQSKHKAILGKGEKVTLLLFEIIE